MAEDPHAVGHVHGHAPNSGAQDPQVHHVRPIPAGHNLHPRARRALQPHPRRLRPLRPFFRGQPVDLHVSVDPGGLRYRDGLKDHDLLGDQLAGAGGVDGLLEGGVLEGDHEPLSAGADVGLALQAPPTTPLPAENLPRPRLGGVGIQPSNSLLRRLQRQRRLRPLRPQFQPRPRPGPQTLRHRGLHPRGKRGLRPGGPQPLPGVHPSQAQHQAQEAGVRGAVLGGEELPGFFQPGEEAGLVQALDPLGQVSAPAHGGDDAEGVPGELGHGGLQGQHGEEQGCQAPGGAGLGYAQCLGAKPNLVRQAAQGHLRLNPLSRVG
mmetsp:Transcript_21114/g.47528  ORF Transcript_21114/g.47528 Transcript_21114/m.47528 type:complete len:321 (-) Transcript_21114:422-1384(-)